MTGAISRGPSLADSVAERVRNDIASGIYKVGDKLPTERDFSEKYGVSRPIVREALGTLKRDGLVQTRQGLGAFVIQTSEAAFRFRGLELDDAEDIQNVIELLMAVEAAATAHAAERRTQKQLTLIEQQLHAMESAIARGESGVEEDIAFHQAIIKASDNHYFHDMTTFLDGRVRNFIRKARASTERQSLLSMVMEEHVAIFDAIANSDPLEARKAAENHLRGAASRLALHLSKATLSEQHTDSDQLNDRKHSPSGRGAS